MGYEINNLYRASYLELPKNKSRERVSREIDSLFGILRSIIILRILFTYFNVLPQMFENALMSLSYPLVAPFYLMIGSTPASGTFDWISAFALSIYSLLAFIVVKITKANVVSSPAEEAEV